MKRQMLEGAVVGPPRVRASESERFRVLWKLERNATFKKYVATFIYPTLTLTEDAPKDLQHSPNSKPRNLSKVIELHSLVGATTYEKLDHLVADPYS